MYLKTLPINRFNTITVCSLTPEKLATKPARVFLKTNGTKILEIPLEKGGQPKKGNEMKNSLKTLNPTAIWRPNQRAIKGSQSYPNARD